MPVSTPSRRNEAGYSLIELLIVMIFIAVIAAIAISTVFFAFDVSRLGQTVGNMRGVTNAIVQYETINGTVPGGGLQPVSALSTLLEPYGAAGVTEDGWGHDLYYEPVTIAGNPTFRLYSYGKDGTPDGAVTGLWLDFYSDTVVESGSFVQTKW